MQRPEVFPTRESQEYYSEEGCHILEILNDDSSPHISLARARVEKGKQTRLHALTDTVEIYYVTRGQGRVTIGAQTADIGIGDCVKIERGVDQNIVNTGSEDLVFLCICHPRFQEENYRNTDQA